MTNDKLISKIEEKVEALASTSFHTKQGKLKAFSGVKLDTAIDSGFYDEPYDNPDVLTRMLLKLDSHIDSVMNDITRQTKMDGEMMYKLKRIIYNLKRGRSLNMKGIGELNMIFIRRLPAK